MLIISIFDITQKEILNEIFHLPLNVRVFLSVYNNLGYDQ